MDWVFGLQASDGEWYGSVGDGRRGWQLPTAANSWQGQVEPRVANSQMVGSADQIE